MEKGDSIVNGEVVALGGNIELTGFGGLERAEMVIVKKVVGNYARRFSELCERFEKLHIVAKPAHQSQKSEVYEVSATVFASGLKLEAGSSGRNLFFVLDEALKKIEKQAETRKEKAQMP